MKHDPEIVREILGAFWKIHILYHAAEEPIAGHWMLQELREHGYDISPGTLYPLLKRLHRRGWLDQIPNEKAGPKAAQLYRMTERGQQVLRVVREQLNELQSEVMERKHDGE